MFGGQDDNSGRPTAGGGAASEDTLNGVNDLATGTPAPASDTSGDGFMATPSEPPQSSVPEPHEEAEDVITPEEPAGQTEQVEPAAPSAPAPVDDNADQLMELKQQALQQLSPLVGHLDQTPEEKFRTTMMLIQASDNQTLLKEAFEAAQAISDDKLRAQALLDIINEINYFTQGQPQS